MAPHRQSMRTGTCKTHRQGAWHLKVRRQTNGFSPDTDDTLHREQSNTAKQFATIPTEFRRLKEVEEPPSQAPCRHKHQASRHTSQTGGLPPERTGLKRNRKDDSTRHGRRTSSHRTRPHGFQML